MKLYLGIDVGSISTNLAVLDERGKVIASEYLRTKGQPISAIKEGMANIAKKLNGDDAYISGVGTTGSARHLTGLIVGADCIKNEITAHAVAAISIVPNVQTVFEIGGQDSKIIIIRNGVAVDFAMNTVCAAGTGSFLDQQANRLNIPIERFGELALQSKTPVRIAGRCTVFAESDMIHKQQLGHRPEDIIAGLCEALVRNYLNNVAKGKEILPPIVFQGGVAANKGIKAAFEKQLGVEIIVPEHFAVMGAVGAALLAKEYVESTGRKTKFVGFSDVVDREYVTSGFECQDCPNLCEVVELKVNEEILARWGDRCGKWSGSFSRQNYKSSSSCSSCVL